ncbi:Uncharacterised protein [Yersinia pekkanenii]|uniref:Uncharacterized protein n=1 Tax=Yersinia pekkanenii TaxID=1288385 RepID=A0A0T9RMN8_9GAMM|nr:hypothetical protein [Yersinia pekkanenii]CNI72326.1 Uncharacterised protein [Yersinia pekkanenii]
MTKISLKAMVTPAKKTITTHEIYSKEGIRTERILTHISTGAHGYESLCIDGTSKELGKECHIIKEDSLPITCPICMAIWFDSFTFNETDFDLAEKDGWVSSKMPRQKLKCLDG